MQYYFANGDSLVSLMQENYFYYDKTLRKSYFHLKFTQEWGFTEQQSRSFLQTVLYHDIKESHENIARNIFSISDRWKNVDTNGSVGNLSVSRSTTWIFHNDLTYEYKYESLESYFNPFGSGYTIPKKEESHGYWAPSDQTAEEIKIILLPISGGSAVSSIQYLYVKNTYDNQYKKYSSIRLDGKPFTNQI